uniref:Uncharacterized protein n=1 Tax=Ixodes ricinus TaxID=34613 RepID=A0A6B0ULD8_IXORI
MFIDDRIHNECNLWRHLPIGAASRRQTLLSARWLYGRWHRELHDLLTRSSASISAIDFGKFVGIIFYKFPMAKSTTLAKFLESYSIICAGSDFSSSFYGARSTVSSLSVSHGTLS